jgi:transcriptional regulator with XRE-family HTH domain
METLGKRIQRLREAKEWSLARLGREMAEKIGRETPYTGELIRKYEMDASQPPREAIKALALVFEKDETYISYGDSKRSKNHRTDADIFYEKYLSLSAADRQIVDLLLKRAGR